MYYYDITRQEYKLTTSPFDDNKGEYNTDYHMYVPTNDYIKLKTGYDPVEEWLDQDKANQKIIEASEFVMDVIYDTANERDRENSLRIKEYKAAKDHNIRTVLLDAMVLMVRAMIQSDINLIGDEHGHILETGVKNKPVLGDDISLQVIRKLKRTELMYTGIYNAFISETQYRSDY